MTVLDAYALVAYLRGEAAANDVAALLRAPTILSEHRPLATADPALAALVRAEGGKAHGLPDSNGRLP